MAAPHEAATFKYSKGVFGCFLVPKKKDQLIYGYLDHNIGFSNEEDCGTFVMEDGTMETFPLRIIDAATLRLLKGDKHFCPCHLGFDAAKARLRRVDFNLRTAHPDDWQLMRAALAAESVRNYRVNNPLKIPPVPKGKKPKRSVLAYPKKSRVAARAGTCAPFGVLEPWTPCGWWSGTITRHDTSNVAHPYVIKFLTKPKPVEVRVSEPVVKALVWNYKYCDQHCIFKGIVGQELLWPCFSPKLKTPILRFTKVLELNRATQLYKLSYRDGETFELSGPLLDRATTREEHLLSGDEVSIDVAEGEPSLYKFTDAHIKEAKSEQGRYKVVGPEMTRGHNTAGKFGSDFSEESDRNGEDSDSDEDSDSSEESSASTTSIHGSVLAENKRKQRLGYTKIDGTQDDVTLIGGGTRTVHSGKESSSSDDDEDSPHRFVEPLLTDPDKQAHIDAVGQPGQLLCFLRVCNGQPVFGILANDVDEARIFGTCIMYDGKYKVMSCHVLGVAALRCKEAPYKATCPRVELLRLLLERNKNKREMLHDIQMVESDFKIAMRRAARKANIADGTAKNPTGADAAPAPAPAPLPTPPPPTAPDPTQAQSPNPGPVPAPTTSPAPAPLPPPPPPTATDPTQAQAPDPGQAPAPAPAPLTTPPPPTAPDPTQEAAPEPTQAPTPAPLTTRPPPTAPDPTQEAAPTPAPPPLPPPPPPTAPDPTQAQAPDPGQAPAPAAATLPPPPSPTAPEPTRAQSPDPGPATTAAPALTATALDHQGISTDAKVDALFECVNVLTQQVVLLTQAKNRVDPKHVPIKKENGMQDIVDMSLNTSDEEDKKDAVRFRPSTVKFEGVEQSRSSVDNYFSGDEMAESPITQPKQRRKKFPGQRVKTARYTQSKQKRDLTERNWKYGVTRNCASARIETDIAEATVPSLAMVPETLCRLGFAIIRNFKKVSCDDVNALYDSDSDGNASGSVPREKCVFTEGNSPSAEQAAFYDTPGWAPSGHSHKPKSEPIFEGVTITSKSYYFGPGKLKQSNFTEPCPRTGRLPRQAMKANSKALRVYNDRYKGQMEDIIRGMFAHKQRRGKQHPAADPKNWHLSQNIVWGGTEHQHAHCDQAKAGEFTYDDIFPFVCVHGFGINEFIMWLLPAHKKRDYGFPYKFPKNALLFFRGDFIHAGWFSQACRAHMEFFPKAAAGWTRTRNPYWATDESLREWQLAKTSFFVPDLRTYPFAFPEFSEEDEHGQQTVSYPSYYTDGLFPHLEMPPRMRERLDNGIRDNVAGPPTAAKKRKADLQHAPRVKSQRRHNRQ